MILGDQACIVLGPDGYAGDIYPAWCDETDAEACRVRGRIVQMDSEPEVVFADFALTPAEVAKAEALALAGDYEVRGLLGGWRAGALDSEGLALLREEIR